ncbi:HD-GYP domain-containing protein [Cytobacillus sp. Hz8]|uniref:HD-GYP domain-containing protein n=1 Tax=Cytobacillus sp. Hz8 TaxID=3347168 RepID=UPI0035D933E1
MRLVETASVQSGTILAKTIYNEKGQVLVSEDVELKAQIIERLISLGITYLYIKDKHTDDIIYKNSISDKLRKESLQTIEGTFTQFQKESKMETAFVIEKSTKQLKNIIRQLLDEIKNNGDLLSLLTDIFSYDQYTFTHSFHVTLYSLAIGLELKLSPKELEILGLGAILHDIGKMNVPSEILLKPGKLTKSEFEVVKKHSEDGFQILRNVTTIPLLVAHCAYQHHERINGSGYPRGISGKEIHRYGKIIAVADVFDAVTSNRIYRRAMLPHAGLEILYSGVGNLFETHIVEAFRRSVAIYPVGLTVELNDGRKGVVSKQNVGLSDRPIIRILEEKGRVVKPYELNLAQELSTMIVNCDTTLGNR